MWPDLIHAPVKYILRDCKLPTAYNRICSDCLNDSIKQYALTMTLVILSAWIAMIGPTYAYMTDGTITTMYNMRIPFIDQYPNAEFIANLIWETSISAIGFIALCLVECGHASVNNTVTLSSKLNILALNKLSNEMEMHKITGEQLHRKLKLVFLNIMHWDE